MKKEYAVNIELVNSDSEWNTADRADWYESYSEAYDAAEKAFEDPDVMEAHVSVWEDGEIDDSPLRMVREDGDVRHYKGETLLWA
ncbi:Uncharacterised protein [[Clostridium] symbiosum]|uniref:Uncharacterized protein n=1 Tax=[Clostridium] symbiosum ATCC 14940 TaxID=411472 RepID=A0ABC9TRR4_CLOSY|nr:hypothetical protein [[Clostridium] symbiosum]ERI74020.1 hypothetical protein CLOSYM_04461 [[Clostridium] symbiosum ATCC 14940]SUY61169.1 Uncharacterised protein [[Clostridium] symbiosum]